MLWGIGFALEASTALGLFACLASLLPHVRRIAPLLARSRCSTSLGPLLSLSCLPLWACHCDTISWSHVSPSSPSAGPCRALTGAHPRPCVRATTPLSRPHPPSISSAIRTSAFSLIQPYMSDAAHSRGLASACCVADPELAITCSSASKPLHGRSRP